MVLPLACLQSADAMLLYYGLVNCNECDRDFGTCKGDQQVQQQTLPGTDVTFTLRHYHFVRYGIEDLTRPHRQER